MAPESYTPAHKAFLQVLFSRSTITFQEARPALAEIFSAEEGSRIEPGQVSFEQFKDFIQTINAEIGAFEYEIRSQHPQRASSREPKDAIYAVVNTTSDPQTQLATLLTPDEIAFVRRVLDAMFDTHNTQGREVMAVKGMDAVNLARVRAGQQTQRTSTEYSTAHLEQTQSAAGAGITKDRAEGILRDLVDSNWFDCSQTGLYTLSTRGLMELGPWLVATYNDVDAEDGEWKRIKDCRGCRTLLTQGQRCANKECNVRMHDFCTRGLVQRQGEAQRRCPVCQEEWVGNKFVGERAARREIQTNAAGRKSTGGGARSSLR